MEDEMRNLFNHCVFFLLALVLTCSAVSQEKIYDDGRYFVSEMVKQFAVQPGGKLFVDVSSGDIEIKIGTDTEVIIKVVKKIDVYSEDEAKAAFGRTPVEFDQRGDGIYVTCENYYRRRRSSVSTNLYITLPLKFDLDLKTSSGDIRFSTIEGNSDIRTSSGDIEGRDVGGYLNARTSSGDIDFGNIKGDVYAHTSSGDIEVGDVSGKARLETSSGDITLGIVINFADLKTSSGDIRVKSTGQELRAHTSSGDISIDKSGGYIRLETSSGDITAYTVKGSADVSTSSGDIELEDVAGPIDARTGSGSIYAVMTSQDVNTDRSCRLVSGSGEITLGLPSNINASIDARIYISRDDWDDYKIYSDFPLKTESRQDERSGRRYRRSTVVYGSGIVNGGGNNITIKTTGSDIIIKKIN